MVFDRRTIASSSLFCLIYKCKNKDLKLSSPEKSGHIIVHDKVHISDGNYEKKLESWLMKMRNAELVFERSYNYLTAIIAARLPELASKLRWKDITVPLVLLRVSG